MDPSPIVLFDGVCKFCNSSVNFIIDRDPDAAIQFAPLQSSIGQTLLKNFRLNQQRIDSIVLIEKGKAYIKSAAAVRIGRYLSVPWNFLSILIVIPPFLLDMGYDLLARNRYRWFGRMDSCRIPTTQVQSRFLD